MLNASCQLQSIEENAKCNYNCKFPIKTEMCRSPLAKIFPGGGILIAQVLRKECVKYGEIKRKARCV